MERIFAGWRTIDWTRLPHSVIHNDANDYNVLIEDGRMSGLLDFGDLVHSATVCDLAIALAYTMLHERIRWAPPPRRFAPTTDAIR